MPIQVPPTEGDGTDIARDENSYALLTDDPVAREARKFFDRTMEWEAVWRARFLEDAKFAIGDSDNGYQWPGEIYNSRNRRSKPCLTINLIRQHNGIISNTARKNKSTVKFIGLGNGATQTSANVIQDLHRHVEWQSMAQDCYTIARDWQIRGGRGWWRWGTEYIEGTFEQELFILPVTDPLSVVWDPDSKQRSGLDASKALIFDDVLKDELFAVYPELKKMNLGNQPLGINFYSGSWVQRDKVRVAEYFRKVRNERELVSFIHRGSRFTMHRDRIEQVLQTEAHRKRVLSDPQTNFRSEFLNEVQWHLIVGDTTVDATDWPGRYIPLVPCRGEEIVLDGVFDSPGHTRHMKDAQRMFNYNAALALDTKIPTPRGWTTMGRLKVGDLVFGQDGRPTPVAKVYDAREGETCYKVTFDNGYSVVTDAGHIWKVEERGKRVASGETWNDRTKSTEQLNPRNDFIISAFPLHIEAAELPIDPYVFGSWLGDGHSRDGRISSHIDDAEEQRCLFGLLGYVTGELTDLVGKGCSFNVFGIRSKLKEMGVADDKHVPLPYLRGSYDQRLSLLQGLMDTDGHYAEAVNQCIFTNGNPYIARAVMELCASLGLKATVSKQPGMAMPGDKYISQATYRVQFSADPDIQVFRLSRKAEKQTAPRNLHWRRTKRIGIKSIVEVESVLVRCITLDTPDRLYLCTEGMIPTHNSGQVEFVAGQTKTPWLVAKKAIEEFETDWAQANNETKSVLIWNHIDAEGGTDVPIPPPTRIDPPQSSPAYQEGIQTALTQIQLASGQGERQMGQQGNERTGAAINGVREQGEVATFQWQDNYETALMASGKIFLDLVPKIYDTKRIRNIMANDGSTYELVIDPGAREAFLRQQAEDGHTIRSIFNPNLGRYDVAPTVGPDVGSKRQETMNAFTLILTQNPGLTGILGDIFLNAMDFEGAQEAALRLKRMVPPQALGEGLSQREQQMQQQLVVLGAAMKKVLEANAKDKLKLVGKDQLRDIEAYKAETDRFKALSDNLPLDPEGLRAVIEQLVGDTLQTNLKDVTSSAQAETETDVPETEAPPVPGANKAGDGEWYLSDPTRKGKYLHIAPLAQEHARPGIVAGGSEA